MRVIIDDFDATARALTNRQAVRTLAHTAHALVRTLELGEGIPFPLPKATVVADRLALAFHIRAALGHRGGQACTHATILFVTSCGVCCCAT